MGHSINLINGNLLRMVVSGYMVGGKKLQGLMGK
jgi:hypothetical protein